MSLSFINLNVTNDTSGDGSEMGAAVACGLIEAVSVEYHASIDVGTDVTIAVPGLGSGVGYLEILVLANQRVSGWWYPRALACDGAGAAHAPEQMAKLAFFGNIRAVVADAGATPYTTKITVFFSCQ